MSVTPERYSSRVRLRLSIEGNEYELTEVGYGYVTFREPIELPPCEGVLSIMVDGDDRRSRVRLVHGALPFDTVVEAESC